MGPTFRSGVRADLPSGWRSGFHTVPAAARGGLPSQIIGPFDELLLGLFAVNWFHSLTHLAIGAVGLAVYRSSSGAMAYALALGVAYTLLFIIGLITDLSAFGGLLPLNGWDDILHILTALLAFGAYFGSRGARTTA